MAAEGARSVIHNGRDRTAAEVLLERIGGKDALCQVDLSQPGGAFALGREVEKAACGRIHALVNNAGIRTEITIEAHSDAWLEAWRKEFQVDFFAAADLCKEALRHFRGNSGGRVDIASRAGQRGYVAEAMPYGAAKAALINLTKPIARNFGKDGVVAIALGWVRTAMTDAIVHQHGRQDAVADIPIGKMAEPADVAELVAFAPRPSQASLNGATLDVNGGSYMR